MPKENTKLWIQGDKMSKGHSDDVIMKSKLCKCLCKMSIFLDFWDISVRMMSKGEIKI